MKNISAFRNTKDVTKLYETSLSRIWQHVSNSQTKSFSIFTSWRQSKTKKQNVEDFNALKSAIRSAGLGYVVVKGHWKECQDPTISYDDCPQEDLVDSIEPSLFVVGSSLANLARLAFEQYEQDAIVYSGPESNGKIVLVFKDMSTKEIGDFKPQTIGQAYSELSKSRHSNPNTFKFEGFEYQPSGFIETLIESEVEKLLKGEKMEKKVYIMRGQSGAGKSTYVKKHFPGAFVCSADRFFINPKTKQYEFNPKKLGAAHGSCRRAYEDALKNNEPEVVVDNTNTTLEEMQYYLNLADAYGYEVEVVRLETPVDVAAARNVHGVPRHAVQRMKDRMVDFPGETIVNGINK